MKKLSLLAIGAGLALAACGGAGTMGTAGTSSTSASSGSVLGSIFGAATNGNTITNIIYDVIGLNKLSQNDLIGTWKYSQPGCAFTSESTLAKAGGEIAATSVKEKLLPTYQKLGISGSNTYFTFNEDNTFSGKIDGKTIGGTYTFNANDQSIQLKTLLLSTTGYVNRNANGISLLFESKKLLTIFQVVAATSGNSTLSTVGDLSKNYDGVRVGFEMSK